jgi:phosphoglycolate phosphatase
MLPTLFPHVKETLNLLKERGDILSVASSRQSVSLRGFLHDMSVEDCISYILGADNVEKSKPDPEPVLKTLRELGIPAEESLVVGDMPVDIIMGLRAGAATCGVTYGNSSRDDLVEAGAGYIIEDISELPGLL